MFRWFQILPALSLAAPCLAQGKPAVRFEDVTRSAGISWVHHNGASQEKFLIETMGGGGAFLDYDGDGLMDLLLIDSGDHPRSPEHRMSANALYRNNGDGTFRDMAGWSGIGQAGYANGVAVGDVDNDGHPDVYITAWGRNTLFRNRGDGTFSASLTAAPAEGWSTSAAFFDMDNDGDLDLFVCQYLDWDYDREKWCGDHARGVRSYCHPNKFDPIASRLYRNEGDGRFADVTQAAGVGRPGKALGVVAADFDRDGWMDLYVANDAVANFLFVNQHDGTFRETGLESEVAYGPTVRPESGMGTDAADFDGDGGLDLIVTNIDYELNNLYSHRNRGFFTDVTVGKGLGSDAMPFSGFGVRFLDFDNDGDLDLAVANGHPLDNIQLFREGVTGRQLPLLFENRDGRFSRVGSEAGAIWGRALNGRALSTGDFDNDGDIDLLFVNNGEAPVLLRNEGGNSNPWWGVRLVGANSNRDAVGASVTVKTDRRTILRYRQGGASYQSAHDPRLHFGFLPGEKLQSVRIVWPSGKSRELAPQEVRLRTYQEVREDMD